MRKIINFLFSDKVYLVIQILLGMWAIDKAHYTIGYGIAMSTILLAIRTYK